MNEEQREAIIAVAKAVVVAWEKIKSALLALAKQFKNAGITIIDELCIDHKAAERNAKSLRQVLRQSWNVKQDTRRLSQVINNKPAHMPRILY